MILCHISPTLCCYALKDRMLGSDDPAAEEAYQDIFRRRFPRIEFATFDSDHFMAGLREQVAKRIHMFLEAASADST